ncbi:MAG: hypothetical protein R3Y06_09795, partial [Faecalibacterium sp.]
VLRGEKPLSAASTACERLRFWLLLPAKVTPRAFGKRQRYSAVENQKEKKNPAVRLKKSLRIGSQTTKRKPKPAT